MKKRAHGDQGIIMGQTFGNAARIAALELLKAQLGELSLQELKSVGDRHRFHVKVVLVGNKSRKVTYIEAYTKALDLEIARYKTGGVDAATEVVEEERINSLVAYHETLKRFVDFQIGQYRLWIDGENVRVDIALNADGDTRILFIAGDIGGEMEEDIKTFVELTGHVPFVYNPSAQISKLLSKDLRRICKRLVAKVRKHLIEERVIEEILDTPVVEGKVEGQVPQGYVQMTMHGSQGDTRH